jgi:hypothetical protein
MKLSSGAVLGILLLFHVITGLLWSGAVPFGRAPDEHFHFEYINWMVEKRSFGRTDDQMSRATEAVTRNSWRPWSFEKSEGRAHRPQYDEAQRLFEEHGYDFASEALPTHESGQPPLYYAAAAVVTLPFRPWSGVMGHWQAARLASLLFGAVAIVAAWWLGGWLFRGEPARWRFLPAALMTAHPMITHGSSVVSNDIALVAMTAIFFAVSLRGRNPLLSAALLGLCLLTKASALALVPWWVLWEGARLWRVDRRKLLPAIALMVVPLVVVLSITYLQRGKVSYISFVQDTFKPGNQKPHVDEVRTWYQAGWVELWVGFGGYYGWKYLIVPFWLQLWRLLVAGSVLAALAMRITGNGENQLARERGRLFWQCLSFAVIWFLFIWGGGWSAVLYTGVSHVLHGRMLLPCLLPLSVVMVLAIRGHSGIPAAVREAWPLVVVMGAVFITAHSLFAVIGPNFLETGAPVTTLRGVRQLADASAAGRAPGLNVLWPWRALVLLNVLLFAAAEGWLAWRAAETALPQRWRGAGSIAVAVAVAVVLLLLLQPDVQRSPGTVL